MTENIIVGLVSGIFATFIVFVFRSIWHAVVIPWFEERIYKDVKIEGAWYSFYPISDDFRQEVVSLERHGHSITGTIICTSGHDEGEKYVVSGSFRNMVLPLTYETSDKSKTDRGTITLKSLFNGERLSGKIAYYHTRKDTIQTSNVVWCRSKNDLDKLLQETKANAGKIRKLRTEAVRIDKELEEVEGVKADRTGDDEK